MCQPGLLTAYAVSAVLFPLAYAKRTMNWLVRRAAGTSATAACQPELALMKPLCALTWNAAGPGHAYCPKNPRDGAIATLPTAGSNHI